MATKDNLGDLRQRIVELTGYIAQTHPSDVEALRDELDSLYALVLWKVKDNR